jgi:hypothetical protein
MYDNYHMPSSDVVLHLTNLNLIIGYLSIIILLKTFHL